MDETGLEQKLSRLTLLAYMREKSFKQELYIFWINEMYFMVFIKLTWYIICAQNFLSSLSKNHDLKHSNDSKILLFKRFCFGTIIIFTLLNMYLSMYFEDFS